MHRHRRRWLLWSALASVYLLVSLYRLSTAVLAGDLMRVFGTTGAELGALHASFFYVYAPLQVVAGVLADRAGPRVTAGAGALAMNLGAVVFGVSGSYAVAFTARVVVGVGASVIFISIVRFLANWYRPAEFARMSGLTVAVAGVGGILATYPLAVLVDAAGWRAAIAGLGVVGTVLSLVVLALVRDSPAEAGLDPIEGVPASPSVSLGDVAGNLRTVLSDPWTWVIGLLLFLATGVNVTVFGLWGIPFVVQVYGVSVTHASVYTLLGSAGLVVGPPAVGAFSDRRGERLLMVVASGVVFTAAYGALALLGSPPLPVVGLVFFLAGFLAGGFVLCLTVMKERYPADASGTATGVANAAAFLGAAAFPALMGAILDVYWTGRIVDGARVYTVTGYKVAFGLAAAAGALMVVLALALHLGERRGPAPGSRGSRPPGGLAG